MRYIIAIGLAVCITVQLVGCRRGAEKKGPPPNAPVPVNATTVEMEPVVYYDEYPGNIVALSQVELRAQVTGYITGIFFKEGDNVRKGQILYEIDRAKYLATYSQSAANLEVAKTNQLRAQKDADRYIFLAKQDAIAKQILDHALADLANAKSQVASARANLVSAKTDLNFSRILAPFNGTIGLSQVKMGALITANQTLLNTISSYDPVGVDFVVNEKELSRYMKYEKNKARPVDSLFTILLPNGFLFKHTGSMYVLDRAVDPQTGTIKVRLRFPNPEHSVKAGMSCTVRVHSEEGAQQLVIPYKAVTEQMGEFFVYVINRNKVAQQKIKPGTILGDKVIVKEGLQQGQQIVVDGTQKLHEGSTIVLGNPQQAH